ncbi:hypothetical protein ACMGE6_03320 [Macrococcus equi]|uniref:hypothetical protein n=1 Tax=Macrococcus equi TaxID=3395462 RepID=UPI0039BEB2C9
MFKNILLIILAIINTYFIFSLSTNNTINLLSLHIIAAGLTFIITVLFLITRTQKITQLLSAITLCITVYHIYLIVMVIYTYVYVK